MVMVATTRDTPGILQTWKTSISVHFEEKIVTNKLL